MARRTATRALRQPPGPVSLDWPYLFRPRTYQRPACLAMERDVRRFLLLWHRRSGKDLTSLALTQLGMARRPGLYLHIYPTFRRGRVAMWDGKDFDGVPFLSRFPDALVAQRNETEMQIVLKAFPGQPSGSIWQVGGADNVDGYRGTNPVGLVLSEYQEMDPAIWTDIFEPILLENGGTAIFDFTPHGENHAFELFEMARQHPAWFCEKLDITMTRRDALGEDGRPVISLDQIEQIRTQGTPEETIQRDYFCSFKGSIRGVIFGDLLAEAERQGRIGRVWREVNAPVGTAWDLGRDGTAIWFYQLVGREIRFLRYYEDRGKDFSHYIRYCRELTPYIFGEHLLPHDAEVTEWTQTETRQDLLEKFGLRPTRVAPRLPIGESIDMTRRLFPRMVFDAEGCVEGLKALRHYRFAWDEAKQEYSAQPIHDWASHGGSALRTLGAAFQEGMDFLDPNPDPIKVITEFSLGGYTFGRGPW